MALSAARKATVSRSSDPLCLVFVHLFDYWAASLSQVYYSPLWESIRMVILFLLAFSLADTYTVTLPRTITASRAQFAAWPLFLHGLQGINLSHLIFLLLHSVQLLGALWVVRIRAVGAESAANYVDDDRANATHYRGCHIHGIHTRAV